MSQMMQHQAKVTQQVAEQQAKLQNEQMAHMQSIQQQLHASMQQHATMPAPGLNDQLQANLNSIATKTAEAAGAAAVAANTISAKVEKEDAEKRKKAEKIEDEEKKVISKEVKKCKDRLTKMLNLEKKVTSEKNLKESLENKNEEDRYPAGVKPFRVPVELSELQDPWIETVQNEKVISIKINKGVSMVKAMEAVYLHGLTFNKTFYCNAIETKLARDKVQLTKEKNIAAIIE